jgi:hypothetical protein
VEQVTPASETKSVCMEEPLVMVGLRQQWDMGLLGLGLLGLGTVGTVGTWAVGAVGTWGMLGRGGTSATCRRGGHEG